MFFAITANGLVSTATVVAVTLHDFRHRSRRLALLAIALLLSLSVAFRSSLPIEQLIALPIFAGIFYTDILFRRVSTLFVIALVFLPLLAAGHAHGLAWIAIAAIFAGGVWMAERVAPVADLITVFASIALYHDIGVIAVIASFAFGLLLHHGRRSPLPYISRMQFLKLPIAGVIAGGTLFILAIMSAFLPPWFPIIDLHRVAGLSL